MPTVFRLIASAACAACALATVPASADEAPSSDAARQSRMDDAYHRAVEKLKVAGEHTGHAIERAAQATEHGVKRAAEATAHGVKRAASATEHGVQRGAEATGHGLEKAADATGRAVHHVTGSKAGSGSSPASGAPR